MALPNFFVIGAARSGTTSLYHYLGQHPDVFMSPVKEPSFLAFMGGEVPPTWMREKSITDRGEYEALFSAAGDAAAVGEASPGYLARPAVAPRIRELVPKARLVAILRDPVDRAYSGYLGRMRDGRLTSSSFEEQLRREESLPREQRYYEGLLGYGFYHRHLSGYLEHFPAEQIHVCLYDDLAEDPIGVVEGILSFLDVDPSFVPDVSDRHGRTGIVRNPLLRFLWSSRARQVLRPVLPKRARDRAFSRVMSDLERPPLAPEVRARLLDVYREDVIALQGLIGRALSGWLE